MRMMVKQDGGVEDIQQPSSPSTTNENDSVTGVPSSALTEVST